MSEKSNATRLADALDSMTTENIRFDQLDEAADELRRLHEVNAELVSLLIRYRKETPLGNQPHMIAHLADAAIAKATGEQQ